MAQACDPQYAAVAQWRSCSRPCGSDVQVMMCHDSCTHRKKAQARSLEALGRYLKGRRHDARYGSGFTTYANKEEQKIWSVELDKVHVDNRNRRCDLSFLFAQPWPTPAAYSFANQHSRSGEVGCAFPGFTCFSLSRTVTRVSSWTHTSQVAVSIKTWPWTPCSSSAFITEETADVPRSADSFSKSSKSRRSSNHRVPCKMGNWRDKCNQVA